MTSILILGVTNPSRLGVILDAACERLDLTELWVMADTDMDAMASAWNLRRYELRRWWVAPVGAGVALIFPGSDGDLPEAERLIWC